MTRYKIEVMETGKQIPYEGTIQDRLHVMQELAQRFKSNIRLWSCTPVDDGQGCVDFEVDIIHEVKYIERENYARPKKTKEDVEELKLMQERPALEEKYPHLKK